MREGLGAYGLRLETQTTSPHHAPRKLDGDHTTASRTNQHSFTLDRQHADEFHAPVVAHGPTSHFGPAVYAIPLLLQCLGIFCKAEVQMDRWLPIPLMIRIGDVESAEELDGKGAYHGAPH